MTATVTMRAFYGANAATMSGPLDTVDLCAADALSGGPVAAGTVSYERWLALRVDSAPAVGCANFWVMCSGDLPAGVSLKFGTTKVAASPVNTPSVIAVKELTSGQKFIFEDATLTDIGTTTRYVVIQEVVASDAASGAIPDQALKWGYSER